MKKNIKRKIDINKVKTEEQEEIMRFIKIILIILVFIGGIYIFTKKVIKKEDVKEKTITEGIINYDKIILGALLNQNYDEYYVFVYDGNDNKAIYYSALIDLYNQKEDSIKVYWADLSNHLNKKFIAENEAKINPKAKKVSDLRVGEYTLIKVNNKKITKYIDNIEAVKKELNLNN